MDDELLLKTFEGLMDFLLAVLGENCEIVLHDVRNLEHSIIAIRNNAITGRKKGDAVTDYALSIMKNEENYQGVDFVENYSGRTADGSKILCSTTYLIRNQHKKIIGMLCINEDITNYVSARNFLERIISKKVGKEKINCVR